MKAALPTLAVRTTLPSPTVAFFTMCGRESNHLHPPVAGQDVDVLRTSIGRSMLPATLTTATEYPRVHCYVRSSDVARARPTQLRSSSPLPHTVGYCVLAKKLHTMKHLLAPLAGDAGYKDLIKLAACHSLILCLRADPAYAKTVLALTLGPLPYAHLFAPVYNARGPLSRLLLGLRPLHLG